MTDIVSREKRSQIMSRIRSKNTLLELSFRKKLWDAGARYRLYYKIFGKPDLVFVSKRVAVFIDSCFWHRCPYHHRQPNSNKDYWEPKFKRNKERAKEVNKQLTREGWKVLRVWEHEIKNNQEKCIDKILSNLN